MFLVYFFAVSEFSESAYQTIHQLFIIAVGLSLLIAGFFRIIAVMASVSVIYVSYIVVSAQRYLYGEDYIFSAGYNIWSILVLPNLLAAYLLFRKYGKSRHWSWFYIVMFAETALIEKMQNPNINADSYYFYRHIGMLNYPAFYLSLFSIIIFFIFYIIKVKLLG